MALSQMDYARIMREYDDRQLRSRKILEARKAEVYDRIPSYKALCDSFTSLAIRQAIQGLTSEEELPESFALERAELSGKKKRLLKENGYPPDYLEPVYICPDCKDTGYTDGKTCHCFEQAVAEDFMREQSKLAEDIKQQNFSRFDLSYYRDDIVDENTNLTPAANIKKVLKICKEFTQNFDTSYDNLLFYGRTGVGKTFLTHCIAGELLGSSHTVVYLTSSQLFDILEKQKFDKKDTGTRGSLRLSCIMDCELLIVDDLGTELTNSFVASALYYLMDSRDSVRRSTIFSTNLSFEDLRERYSERVFSRFMNYTFLKILGDDIRILKALNK